MCDVIRHRGPDEEGIEIRGPVGMGICRLSIIDLKGGSQPIFNEDGSIWTVMNGEIYNFRELREELEAKGHFFKTRSDTEVIVHAYEEYGSDFVSYLNGMFAVSIHDQRRNILLLARDHLGVKPLYYAFNSRRLIWGSEIKALLASGMVDGELDMDALGQFLAWEYCPGRMTLFKAIRKLEAGNMLLVHLHRPEGHPRPYWDVPEEDPSNARDFASWADTVDDVFQACVKRQMVSDVPVGAFLSGGVDSSLMVHAMGPARTFSIGFDDLSYNELPWAERVAKHLGVDHVVDILRPDVESLFDKLMFHMDDPIGDFSIFPTFLISQHARNSVKVALSGDGGDELFGGYETYQADQKAKRLAWVPWFFMRHGIFPLIDAVPPGAAKKGLVNKMKRFVEGLHHDPKMSHARWRLFLGSTMRGILFKEEVHSSLVTPVEHHIVALSGLASHRDPINRSLYVDLKSYLCDNCLVKVDRMSMAVSLETRVPYLDRDLVELAFSIPGRWKVNAHQTKILLKSIAARHVPRECVYRPKEGFSIPIKHWLRGNLRPLMEDLLNPKTMDQEGLFRPQTIQRLKEEHLAARANHSHILWSLMVFQAWRRRFLGTRTGLE